jgi:hypothetical protein
MLLNALSTQNSIIRESLLSYTICRGLYVLLRDDIVKYNKAVTNAQEHPTEKLCG